MKLRHMSLHVPKLHYTYQCIGITSLFVQEHFLAESNMISRSHPTALASIAVHLTLTSGKSKVLNMIKHGYHMLFLFYVFVCFFVFFKWGKARRDFLLVLFSNSPFQSPRPYIVHPVYPSNFYIAIVFNFSWVLQSSLKKSKTRVKQNFGG